MVSYVHYNLTYVECVHDIFYVYGYVCVCVHECACIHTCMYVCSHVHVSLCMLALFPCRGYVHVCNGCVRTCVCVNVYIMYMHVCMCVYLRTYVLCGVCVS